MATKATPKRRKTDAPVSDEPQWVLDDLTGLPLLPAIYDALTAELTRRVEAGFLFFDVVQFRQLQNQYGREATDEVLRLLGETLREQRGKLFRESDVVAVGGPGSDYFVIFLFSPPRRKEKFSQHDLKLICNRVQQKLTNVVNEAAEEHGIPQKIDFHSGYTLLRPDRNLTTERLIYEAQKEAAMKSQLEEVMVQFIGNVSHELRTPLTCIRGYTETLLEGAMADQELCRRWLQIMNDEAQRLERLIKDLLDLSMIESRQVQLRFRHIDMARVAEDVINVLRPYAQKSMVDLVLDVNEELPRVSADEDRLRQIIINLVDNAIKYGKPKHGNGQTTVKVQLRRDGPDLVTSVIDEGPGIPESELDRIFERFYRVEKGRTYTTGRGLGLSIAKHIAEAHGGAITVTSELEKGTQFNIHLPLEDGSTGDREDDLGS